MTTKQFEYGQGVTYEIGQITEAVYPKRKFSLTVGLKRCYAELNDYFGISSISDQLWFYSLFLVLGAVGLVCLMAKIQLVLV